MSKWLSFSKKLTYFAVCGLLFMFTAFIPVFPAQSFVPADDDYLCDFPQKLNFYNLYRWMSYEIPLKVYIPDIPAHERNSLYKPLVQKAFAKWSEVIPPFKFQFVSSPQKAQIVIQWTDFLPESESVWGELIYPQPYFNTSHQLFHKAKIFLALKHSFTENIDAASKPGVDYDLTQSEFLAEATHFIGHTLGLPHSKNRDDIMSAYFFSMISTKDSWSMTPRDISSIHKLYSLSPRLEGPPCNGGN